MGWDLAMQSFRCNFPEFQIYLFLWKKNQGLHMSPTIWAHSSDHCLGICRFTTKGDVHGNGHPNRLGLRLSTIHLHRRWKCQMLWLWACQSLDNLWWSGEYKGSSQIHLAFDLLTCGKLLSTRRLFRLTGSLCEWRCGAIFECSWFSRWNQCWNRYNLICHFGQSCSIFYQIPKKVDLG